MATTLACATCTRSSVPVDRIETDIASFTPHGLEAVTDEPSVDLRSGRYVVVWKNLEEPLIARNPAGLSGSTVGELGYNLRGLELTGASTRLGSSIWVEITLPSGGTGWVNSWNLSEDVGSQDFCNDSRVLQTIDTFAQAVRESSGQILTDVSNPDRGLILRHNWWNPEIVFSFESLQNIFQDPSEIDWGVQGGTEFPIQGTFQDVIAPLLEEVFTDSPELNCNELRTGNTTQEIIWPEEYVNINYYAVYRPAPDGGNELDWRTWVLGFEYIDAQPYLTVLLQYRGEI